LVICVLYAVVKGEVESGEAYGDVLVHSRLRGA